ncbi:MAG: iron(III) transport system substrate-binding protein [Alphaproteobacteria bacterium]|jgi:iron(III) transport system substrate-binding protein|nr:iron(III) transport system substrate-binding protein [Alphaproteobacteria bacterium]
MKFSGIWPKRAKGYFLAILLCLPLKSLAQTPSADIAVYAGTDRAQRLLEGAKKEGSLTLYSSLSPEEITAIGTAFEAKYGIKLQNWRGDSENIVRRAVVEARAGRYDVDVAETSGTEMEALKRENLLRELRLPVFDDLLPQAIMPHRQWIATRLIVFVAAYNTNIIKPADAPKTYEDLLDPKWKGKLGIESDDANWLMTAADTLGRQKTEKLFRDIVSTNGMSVRKGHTLLAQLVVSGEVPLALTAYVNRIDQYKSRGAPVEPLFLSPVIALPTGAGIMRNAPHPYAAVLFMDYLLSPEGQQILATLQSIPTNRKVPARGEGMGPLPELTFVDVPKLIDEGDKWTKLYRDIFNPAR